MLHGFLIQAAVFLAAAAIAAPLAKRLQISSVLSYLIAGMLIGPYGLGRVYSLYPVESILNIAEFGVVLLLFLIGLERCPCPSRAGDQRTRSPMLESRQASNDDLGLVHMRALRSLRDRRVNMCDVSQSCSSF
jgi:hypothetical protein